MVNSLWITHLKSYEKLTGPLKERLEEAAFLLYPRGRFDDANKIFASVASMADKQGNREAAAIAKLGMTDYILILKDMKEPDSSYAALAKEFNAMKDPSGEAFASVRRAWIAGTFNQFSSSEELCIEAEELAAMAEDDYVLGYVHYTRAMVATKQNHFTEARRLIAECEHVRTRIRDWHGVGAARIGLAKLEAALGNFGRGIQTIAIAREMFLSMENQSSAGATATHMAAMCAEGQASLAPLGTLLTACSSGDYGAALIKGMRSSAGSFAKLRGRVISFAPVESWPG